jgi:hypothetical protein
MAEKFNLSTLKWSTTDRQISLWFAFFDHYKNKSCKRCSYSAPQCNRGKKNYRGLRWFRTIPDHLRDVTSIADNAQGCSSRAKTGAG